MSDLALGQILRRAIDQQRQTLQGQIDPRRLENQLGGWVNAEQQPLLPALSFLLRSPLLSRSLQDNPSGPRLEATRSALLQELGRLYSPAVCQRLAQVLQGLLPGPEGTAPTDDALGEASTLNSAWPEPQAAATAPPSEGGTAATASTPSAAVAWTAPAPATTTNGNAGIPVNAPQTPATASSGRGLGLLVALLCFLVGGLGAALALLVWLQRTPGTTTPAINGRSTNDAAPATANPTPPPLAPAVVTLPDAPAPSEPSPGGTAAAIASVEQLYSALSARDYGTARSLFGPVAADQFDPAFFAQFSRVSVSDLREVSSNDGEVQLEGRVRFDYPDGSAQVESRSFTVDTSSQPALITASAFGQVLQAR